jgi:hypothetical protein
MSTPLVNLIVAGLILALVQVLAAIPWVSAFDGRPFRRWIADPTVLAYLSGGTFALGQFRQRAEAIQLWHLHIEKGQRGLLFADERHGFAPVFRLAY